MGAPHSAIKGQLSQTELLKDSFREILGHLSIEEISRNRELISKASAIHRAINEL